MVQAMERRAGIPQAALTQQAFISKYGCYYRPLNPGSHRGCILLFSRASQAGAAPHYNSEIATSAFLNIDFMFHFKCLFSLELEVAAVAGCIICWE